MGELWSVLGRWWEVVWQEKPWEMAVWVLAGTGVRDQEGIQQCQNSTTKMDYAVEEENRPLLRQQGPCMADSFFTNLLGLKQLNCLYVLNRSENQANLHAGQQESNQNTGTKDKIDAGDSEKEDESAQDCFELPAAKSEPTNIFSTISTTAKASGTNLVNTVSIPVSTASPNEGLSISDTTNSQEDDSKMPPLEDIHQDTTDGIFTHSSYDDEGAEADFTNLETVVNV
ncbi:hypothetical protein Tco_0146551 [Tanacetum coccineum]